MQNDLFGEAGGLQCLTCDILEAIDYDLKTFPQQLLDSGLMWYWRSERDTPPIPGQPETPLIRSLALLTPENASDMQVDLEEDCGSEEERGAEGWRGIELYGCSSPLRPPLAPSLKAAKANFRRLEPSPLECVIHAESDQRTYQYIFFPPNVHLAVQKLWEEWRIDPAAAVRRKWGAPYFLLDDCTFFPVFLRKVGEVEIVKLGTIDDLERKAKLLPLASETYEGWDRQAIPVRLVENKGELSVERKGEQPDFAAALQAFSAYAKAHGGEFDPNRQFHDLNRAFTALTSEVEGLRPRSWIKRLFAGAQ